MAKQVKKEVKDYLYGTFLGKGKISIDAKTDPKKVEAFLKDNPSLKDRITDKALIKAQRELIK